MIHQHCHNIATCVLACWCDQSHVSHTVLTHCGNHMTFMMTVDVILCGVFAYNVIVLSSVTITSALSIVLLLLYILWALFDRGLLLIAGFSVSGELVWYKFF